MTEIYDSHACLFFVSCRSLFSPVFNFNNLLALMTYKLFMIKRNNVYENITRK